jgi:hypothetical protein
MTGRQVRLREPVELARQAGLALEELLASRLQLLREPFASVSASERGGNLLRVREQFAEVLPN